MKSVQLIGLVGRVFANGPGDLASIPGRIIPKTLKMVLDTSLLNTQKYELISDVLLWTPTHGLAKAGWPARTYIQQLCEDTGCCPEDLPETINDREKWRERVRDIRATSTTWWWWWSRVKWRNPGKGVASSPTPQCCSYWKRSLLVTLNCCHQLYSTGPWVECSPMVWEIGVQSWVKSYQRLKKWYLILPCLTLTTTR